MVICFDVSTDAKRALDDLLGTGQFRNQSEAISMALVNYEIIQRSVSTGDQVVMQSNANHISKNTNARTVPEKQTVSIKSTSEVRELFRLATDTLNLEFPDVPSVSVEELPPAQWFFGQYNKFLPVKATCRALFNLLQRNPGGVPIAEAMETISGAACALGDHLNALDKGSARHRDDAFAVAFPSTSSGGPGSKIRFANQFIGDLRLPKHVEGRSRQTKINGLPAAMKFIVCSEGKSPLLGLTKPGADFALLQNPILDRATAESPTQKFNEEEVQFLVTHIRHTVPEEAAAYTAIITAIGEGANSPDKVDEYLSQHFRLQVVPKAEEEHQITQTFLTTQRTGAISRMVELGLITRLREGLRVTYQISSTGQHFIDGLSVS